MAVVRFTVGMGGHVADRRDVPHTGRNSYRDGVFRSKSTILTVPLVQGCAFMAADSRQTGSCGRLYAGMSGSQRAPREGIRMCVFEWSRRMTGTNEGDRLVRGIPGGLMTDTQTLAPARELAETNKVHFPNETAAYRKARNALLVEEIELRRHIERVASERRMLPPGGEIPRDFEFVSLQGPVRLSE